MKLVYISRSYPPVVGGMETHNYEIGRWLSSLAEVIIIANKKGKWLLPLFLPWCLLKLPFILPRCDAVLLGDGVLCCLAWCIKLFSRKPVVCVVHGLDLTYGNTLYQKVFVGQFMKKVDRFIAVGNETRAVGIGKGIPESGIVFIPNGIDPDKPLKRCGRQDIEGLVGRPLGGAQVLLTSGRLARRKGVAWFIEHVMPLLPESVHYLIAGDGPARDAIASAISSAGLGGRVNMLGYVTDDERDMLLSACDLFVQPNIPTPGDMEGFGISVIEAALHGLPVIAAELEGLRDAVKDGCNGFLVTPGDAAGYARKIQGLLADDAARKAFGEKARAYVMENCSWPLIARRYLEVLQQTISDRAVRVMHT